MPRLPKVPALAPVGEIPEGLVVDLPGRGSTYVVDTGPSDGPTYVLLHSLACTGLMTWYPALQMMREFGRVVIFDQRCHGQGISPPRILLEDCADDVTVLADTLDFQLRAGWIFDGIACRSVGLAASRRPCRWTGAVRGGGRRQPRLV